MKIQYMRTDKNNQMHVVDVYEDIYPVISRSGDKKEFKLILGKYHVVLSSIEITRLLHFAKD